MECLAGTFLRLDVPEILDRNDVQKDQRLGPLYVGKVGARGKMPRKARSEMSQLPLAGEELVDFPLVDVLRESGTNGQVCIYSRGVEQMDLGVLENINHGAGR